MENEQQEISIWVIYKKITEWLRLLKSNILFVLLIGFAGAALMYYFNFKKVPLYTATLSFAMEEDNGGGKGIGIGGLASQLGVDIGANAGGAFSGNNLTELMKSRSILEKTLLSKVSIGQQQILLVDYYATFTGLTEAIKKDNRTKNFSFSENPATENISLIQDSLITVIYYGLIENNLTIDQKDKKISITDIIVKSEDQLFAKIFTETLVQKISEFYTEIKTKKSTKNIAILQRQADSIRIELNASITGVAASNDNVYNLNPAFNVKRVPSSVKQVDVQANTAILVQLVQNLETSKLALLKETPLVQVIDKPILPLPVEKPSLIKPVVFGFIGFSIAGVFLVIGKFEWKRFKKIAKQNQ